MMRKKLIGFGGGVAFQCGGYLHGDVCQIMVIDIAGAGECDGELFADAPGMRGEEYYPAAQTDGLTYVVGNKDDGLAALFPNVLNIAVVVLHGTTSA